VSRRKEGEVPGSKFLVPSSWFQVPGSKFLVPSSWFQVPGSRGEEEVPGSCPPVPNGTFGRGS